MASTSIVGEARVALTFETKDLEASKIKAEKVLAASGTNSGKFFSDNFLSSLAANLTSSIVQKALSGVFGAMDTAIKRVDTLNNSSKVFQALGYAGDETSKSMDRLVEYLDGLPTSMTTAISGVQSLAASFGSLDKGTDYFIAMNDAGLAFGATTEMVDNAINQLGQLSLDGPLDAATWNSLRNSGFSPVFAAMAKEAGITVGELKESFGSKGSKTVQDFLNELVRMDKEGTSSMDSLSKIARENTNGIGTAMENVQNRIGKAIAKVIDHIGSEKIADAINTVSSSFSGIADVVIGLIDFLGQNQWILDSILVFLGALLALGIAKKVVTFFGAISTFISANPIVAGLSLVVVALSWVLTHLEDVGNFFNTVFGAIGDFVGWIATNIGNFFDVVFKWIGENLSWVGNLFSTIFNAIWGVVSTVFGTILSVAKTVFSVIVTTLQIVGGIFATIFGVIFNVVKTVFTAIWNVANPVFNAIRTAVQAVGNFFHSIFQGIGSFVGGVFNGVKDAVQGAWNFITGIFSGLANFFGSIFSAAWNTVKAVFSTGGQIFMGIVDGIANAFRTIVNAIITGINFVVAIPFNAINGFLGVLRGIDILGFKPFGWVGEISVPQIPLLAKGGVVDSAQAAIIGEAGQEAVLPLENNTGNWAGLLARVLVEEMEESPAQLDRNITIEKQEFIINNDLDFGQVERGITTALRRATI